MWQERHGEKPFGYKVDSSCGKDCCINPSHLVLKKWDSFKSQGKWTAIREQLLSLKMDESFDLPDFPSDEKSRALLVSNISNNSKSCRIKFALRSLRTGGIQLIRLGEWGTFLSPAHISTENYPVMCWNGWNRSRDWSLESGAAFLGLLWGTWDEPKEARARVAPCSEKGCPFPRLEGSTVCRQHWEWNGAVRSYPRELKLSYKDEAFARASDNRSINSVGDAQFHSGWLGEDKYGFLHTTTIVGSGSGTYGSFQKLSKGERENDKWWKENVIDQGIEAPGVMVRKTSKELKAEMDAMLEESLAKYSAYSESQSLKNIEAFWKVKKEPNPIHDDPFHPEGPRMKIGDGAAVSLKGKMRRGGGHGQGIRKKQRNRAPGWTSSRHNHDPQYFTRDTVRGDMDFADFEPLEMYDEMPETLNLEEA